MKEKYHNKIQVCYLAIKLIDMQLYVFSLSVLLTYAVTSHSMFIRYHNSSPAFLINNNDDSTCPEVIPDEKLLALRRLDMPMYLG